MGQRDRQGIRRIRLQFTRDSKQHADHVLNLCLVRTTAADDGLLHFFRRVFSQGQPLVDHGADCRTTCLSKFQCGIGVARHEHALDGRFNRHVRIDQARDLVENLLEA